MKAGDIDIFNNREFLHETSLVREMLKAEEDILYDIDREDAPSGEWSERDIEYNGQEEYIRGIKSAIEAIGTCAGCELYRPYSDEYGHCMKTRDSLEAIWTRIEVDRDDYCKSFKRITSSCETKQQ